VASALWPGSILAAAITVLALAPGLAKVSGDPTNPVDDQQLSEPLRNKVYEELTPLIKEKDRRQIELKETPPPEAPETPEKDYQLKDPPSKIHAEETQGGLVPSKGHPMSDQGQTLPDGRYQWCGPDIGCLTGVVPNPTYAQLPADPPAEVKDVGNGAMMDKLRQAMNGLPITNSQFAILAGMAPQAAVDQAIDPKGWRAAMKQIQQTQTAQSANQQAESAEHNTDCAFDMMRDYLINVANEGAATPASANLPYKTYSQAVWMIQQMYKQCYLPMALLLLLPGAILTQVKGLVTFMILGGRDEDAISPFTGIIRSMMAIFLIPATQLIVSYVIDIGNSLTYTVKEHINISQVTNWAHEQTFNTTPDTAENFIKRIPDTGTPDPTRGKLASAAEKSTIFERQSHMTASLQNIFNTINNLISQGLVILNGFQIILMCYLFLLGPIAAAFFAWPSGVGRNLFKTTFSNWMDGVVILALWKFWWCIVLLCMSVRLSSGNVNPTDQFEMYIYTAFMAILLFVPFQPFDFRPGDIVSRVLEKAAQHGGAGAAGGGSGGAGGCGGSSKAGGGNAQASGSSDSSSSGGGEGGPSQSDSLAGGAGVPGADDSDGLLRHDTSESSSSEQTSMVLASTETYGSSSNVQSESFATSEPPRADAPESSDNRSLNVAMKDIEPPPLSDQMAA
jgi:hypothetical protein